MPEPGVGDSTPPSADVARWIRMTRRLIASPERVYRAFADPETLARWFPDRVEGSLAPNARTVLVWPRRRVWWDVRVAESDRRFSARRPWLADDSLVTTFTVTIVPRGYGSRVSLEDGPFPIEGPGALDAWAEAIEGWTEALDQLRAFVDFSVDIRERSYEAEAL
jgi:uncharacterized protein YndB with AHSA1/START domain